tara:strand:+ start:443 stop:1609 length:1167 start_codon:yes stop_codon:yes gene_type:complete
MANIFNGFFDNLVSGTTNPKGNMADFQHAARLYTDDAFRLAPKSKFLYHVVLELSPSASKNLPQLDQRHKNEINLLVKSADLPKVSINTVTKNMYNRKKNLQTSLEYDPVNITFHDDNLGITTMLMEAYYRYYYADGNHYADGVSAPFQARNTYGPSSEHSYRFGFDNDSVDPFFTKITIFQMARHQYTGFTLVNPLITGFQHDSVDQADATGTMQNQMTIAYESIFYSRGATGEGSPKGFGAEHYDQTPSPLSLAGGGTESLFGIGGVAGGISSVLGDIAGGQFNLGTALTAFNTVKNAKSITKEGLRQEGFRILNNAITNIGKENTSGLRNTAFPKTKPQEVSTATEGGEVNQTLSSYATKVRAAQEANLSPGEKRALAIRQALGG